MYNQAQALVAAATDEDFGMTVVEALSYGVPVIAFNQGGYTETVIENLNGVFFNELSVDSLCKAVQQFNDESFSKESIRQSVQRFSVDYFRHYLEEFVRRVMAGKN